MDSKKISYCEKIAKDEYPIVLNFLKAKFPLFHNSNFFFRDFQYGLKRFFIKKEIYLTIPESEELANRVAKFLEDEQVFIKVNKIGWRLNYPEFVTDVPGDPFDLKLEVK